MSRQDASRDGATGDGDAPVAELEARVAQLEAENARLRRDYGQSKRVHYRRSTMALFALGVLGVLGALAFPDDSDVLFALGGTGLFAGVLTYYLVPEQFVGVDVGEGVYEALVENGTAIRSELGLSDATVYVPPMDRNRDGDRTVRLFVPRQENDAIPDDEELSRTFVMTDGERLGVAFRPTGSALFGEFERALRGDVEDGPDRIAEQLADGVVEQFELAGSLRLDVDAGTGRATFGVVDSAFGPVDRFDHPIPSFLAVGLARGLDRPVAVETTVLEDDDHADYLVTCRWSSAGGTGGDES